VLAAGFDGGGGGGVGSRLIPMLVLLQGGRPEDEAAGMDKEGAAARPQKDQDLLHTPGAGLAKHGCSTIENHTNTDAHPKKN